MSPDIPNMIEAIAREENIPLYKRFTESEASAILDVSVQTLRRIRERGEIAFIRVSERNIRYFGLHLCQYILSKVEDVICPETPKKDSNSVTTGLTNDHQEYGSDAGTIQNQDKLNAAQLALKSLNKPKKN